MPERQIVIRWDKIKDGFRGFERLALAFVMDKENGGDACEWEGTSATRDGNKDGVAILVGWHPNSTGEPQWWMEAKYSKTCENLTRYRLDATIVSAFKNNNVERLIFVTNINIRSKVVSDIQLALLQSATCDEAVFYTGRHLEQWLLEDHERYIEYFGEMPVDEFNALERPNLDIVDGSLEVYPQRGVFKEPVFTLYHSERYTTNIGLYARKNNLQAVFNIETKGIYFDQTGRAKRKRVENLRIGHNEIELPIKLAPTAESGPYTLTISLNGQRMHSSRSLQLINEPLLEIAAQKEAIELLERSWKSLKGRQKALDVIIVTGESGTGKTRVAQVARNEVAEKTALLHEVSFGNDREQNLRKFSRFILGFLFPYIHPLDIDFNYVSDLELPTTSLKPFIAALEDSDYATLTNCLNKELFETVVPPTAQSNARLIICDDINKLDKSLQEALFLFIAELKEKGYSALCLLLGQRSTDWQGAEDLRTSLAARTTECSIALSDIEHELSGLPFSLDAETANQLFGSIIETTMFLEHLKYADEAIRDLSDFKRAYHLFRAQPVYREYILKKFNDSVMKSSLATEAAKDLIRFIYFCPEAQPASCYSKESTDDLDFLFSKGLIKRNINDEIVPFHDLYAEVFRNEYSRYISDSFTLADASDVATLTLVLAQTDLLIDEDLLVAFRELFFQQRYSALFQLLDPYFNSVEYRENIRRRCNDSCYFELFWLYVYANANAGQYKTGLEGFMLLRKEIGATRVPEVAAIKYLSTFESFNSSYEHMRYEEAEILSDELRGIDERAFNSSAYASLIQRRRRQAESINIMLDAERGDVVWKRCKQYVDSLISDGEFSKYAFDVYRVAMTQLVHKRDESLEIIEKCRDALSNKAAYDKGALMTSFAIEYFECSTNCERSLNKLNEIQRGIQRHFYNDYNRHLPSMAFLYLMKGDREVAQSLLYEYSSTPRKRSERQDAIFKLTEAALLLAGDGNAKTAWSLLKEVVKTFSICPNYLPAIQHNVKLACEVRSRVDFELYFGQPLEDDIFYFDARFIY